MRSSAFGDRHVAVVGAGIAGLSAARRLLRSEDPPEVTVLEVDDRPGGKIRSANVAGLELEAGPDSLLARKPEALALARELGLRDDLAPTGSGVAHLWSDRGLLPFPSGPFGISTDLVELARWPGLSLQGKARAALDLVLPRRRSTSDEPLGSLLRRRLGDEVTDALVAPLLGGVFAGDVDRLGVRATFAELAAWEQEQGSLIRGARAALRGARTSGPARPPMFVRVRGGLRRITDGLVGAIGAERIRCGSGVTGVEPLVGGRLGIRSDGSELEVDAAILATPAFVTADLLDGPAPWAAGELRSIPYASTAVVLLVYPEGSGPALPDSSGFVVPRGRRSLTACTFVSRKWPDAAFGDRAVLRCFVGAAGDEGALERSDDELLAEVVRELALVLPLPGRVDGSRVVRWPRAMPQYGVGHLERVSAIERALPPGVAIAGSAYRGAGVPDCIRQGTEAAERVRRHLARG